MKIKRKKTLEQSLNKRKDITGVILVALATILLFAFVLGGKRQQVGTIGAVLSGSLLDFIGYVCYLIPAVLILWAVSEFRHKKFPVKYSGIWGMTVFIVGCSILLHLVRAGAGGILGDFISDVIIKRTFGAIGAYIISLALLLVSFVLLTDIPLKKIILFFGSKAGEIKKRFYKKMDKKKKERFIRKKEKKKQLPKIMVKETGQAKLHAPAPEPQPMHEAESGYSIPLDLLNDQPETEVKVPEEEARGEKLREVLFNFDIETEISGIQIGPSITRYEITVPGGIKLSRIRNLSSNIAMAMEAKTVRLLTPIPGKATVGVEVPAVQQDIVFIKSLIASPLYQAVSTEIPYCLGKSVSGELQVVDMASMPHILLAGATGSGKSIAIHTLINSILFKSSPETVKFLFMDPKRVELPIYNGIPHLVTDVVTDPRKAVDMLQAVAREMDARYDVLAKNNIPDITAYNRLGNGSREKMARMVVVIDELADLMVTARDRVENSIIRISQMARAVGIHLVLATQRPSVDIITGIIKANLPARIAFNVISGVDSRTILDTNGAEKLLGKGDMLYQAPELPQPERMQGAYISREEVERVAAYLRGLQKEYGGAIDLEARAEDIKKGTSCEDDLYPEAVRLVIKKRKASTSLLQRKLRIGYNRAARIIDIMEENGIIGEDMGTKGRPVLVTEEYVEKLT